MNNSEQTLVLRRSRGRPQGNEADRLDERRAEIVDLYVSGRTLKSVMEIMKDKYNILASIQQYKRKLRQWKVIKSTPGSLNQPNSLTQTMPAGDTSVETLRNTTDLPRLRRDLCGAQIESVDRRMDLICSASGVKPLSGGWFVDISTLAKPALSMTSPYQSDEAYKASLVQQWRSELLQFYMGYEHALEEHLGKWSVKPLAPELSELSIEAFTNHFQRLLHLLIPLPCGRIIKVEPQWEFRKNGVTEKLDLVSLVGNGMLPGIGLKCTVIRCNAPNGRHNRSRCIEGSISKAIAWEIHDWLMTLLLGFLSTRNDVCAIDPAYPNGGSESRIVTFKDPTLLSNPSTPEFTPWQRGLSPRI